MRAILVHLAKKSLRSRARGQGLTEFALVLPVFFLIVVGIVDLGRGIASYTVVSNAAHEGSRAGIFPGTADAVIRAAAKTQTAVLGTLPDGNITVAPQPTGGQTLAEARPSGGNITVTVTFAFYPVTPLLSRLVDPESDGIPMSATSTMPIE